MPVLSFPSIPYPFKQLTLLNVSELQLFYNAYNQLYCAIKQSHYGAWLEYWTRSGSNLHLCHETDWMFLLGQSYLLSLTNLTKL